MPLSISVLYDNLEDVSDPVNVLSFLGEELYDSPPQLHQLLHLTALPILSCEFGHRQYQGLNILILSAYLHKHIVLPFLNLDTGHQVVETGRLDELYQLPVVVKVEKQVGHYQSVLLELVRIDLVYEVVHRLQMVMQALFDVIPDELVEVLETLFESEDVDQFFDVDPGQFPKKFDAVRQSGQESHLKQLVLVGLQECNLHQFTCIGMIIRLIKRLKKKGALKHVPTQTLKEPVIPISLNKQQSQRQSYQKQHQQLLLKYFKSPKANSFILPLVIYELPLLGSMVLWPEGFQHIFHNYLAFRTVIYSSYPFLYGTLKLNSLYLVSQDSEANVAFSIGLFGLVSALASLFYEVPYVLAISAFSSILWVLVKQSQGKFILKIGILLIVANMLTIAYEYKLSNSANPQPYRLKEVLKSLKKNQGSLILED